jgi:quinohemoprotein ethanol dehydrogenase
MMQESTHNIFKNIVLGGAYSQNGMASFEDVLEESDVEAIQQYIISLQTDLYEEQEKQKRAE